MVESLSMEETDVNKDEEVYKEGVFVSLWLLLLIWIKNAHFEAQPAIPEGS